MQVGLSHAGESLSPTGLFSRTLIHAFFLKIYLDSSSLSYPCCKFNTKKLKNPTQRMRGTRVRGSVKHGSFPCARDPSRAYVYACTCEQDCLHARPSLIVGLLSPKVFDLPLPGPLKVGLPLDFPWTHGFGLLLAPQTNLFELNPKSLDLCHSLLGNGFLVTVQGPWNVETQFPFWSRTHINLCKHLQPSG